MKKIKDNKIVNLKGKNEIEKAIELGKISKKLNYIFEKNKNIKN